MKINTNLSSLIVQSNLKASTYGLNTAIERMSTGFKINHAKDNAANYSINTKLSSKLSSYKIAQDNVYMGLDMVMTAMDSLDLISSHLSRMRDLAEQAANGTYGASSLQSIQSEINARSDEITRLVSNTEFNNVKLFDGEPERTGDFIQAVRPLTEDEAIAQGYTIITTADELQAMQYDLSGKYILMNDIDLSGYEWTPVGNNDMGPFKGVFNGNGKVVKNLSINRPSEKTQGFFGYASNAIIKNVGLENVDISCKEDSAGLLACANSVYSNASITNCYVTGKLKGFASVSGLASDLRGTVEACYTNVSISVSTGGNGGLIGTFRGGSIKNSYSEGNMYGMSAEFDKVKVTLGELKSIEEGLIVDLCSVYDNKVSLKVGGKVVAAGELVIINDRFGVRIEKVNDSSSSEPADEHTEAAPDDEAPAEDFDYSDFEVEENQ